jgi:hypothetical protein
MKEENLQLRARCGKRKNNYGKRNSSWSFFVFVSLYFMGVNLNEA